MSNNEKAPHLLGALTAARFIEEYGVAWDFARKEIASGRLTALKTGSGTIIRRRDAEAWLDQLPTVPTDAERELWKSDRLRALSE